MLSRWPRRLHHSNKTAKFFGKNCLELKKYILVFFIILDVASENESCFAFLNENPALVSSCRTSPSLLFDNIRVSTPRTMSSDLAPQPIQPRSPIPFASNQQTQQQQPPKETQCPTPSERRPSVSPHSSQPPTKTRRLSTHSSRDETSELNSIRSGSPDHNNWNRPSSKKHSRDIRRVWNRRALESSGISDALLHALDAFTNTVPPIPTTIDLSRKIPIRNMRKWIGDLQNPEHDTVWKKLLDVLGTDNSAQNNWGTEWDHDICRFILGVLVSEDQSKNRAEKRQTRQAVNNAIKRELTCPTESGISSRSKTFRDLFREKCTAAGIDVPPLSNPSQKNLPSVMPCSSKPPAKSLSVTPATVRVVSEPTLQPQKLNELPLTPIGRTPLTKGVAALACDDSSITETSKMIRSRCSFFDEWGRTAWWKLSDNNDVRKLPKALAVDNLGELRALLLDFRWIMRAFRCVDFSHGMRQPITEGYDVLLHFVQKDKKRFPSVEVEGFRLIRNAFMLIMPILARDKVADPKDKICIAHLATQLVGRLLNHKRRFPSVAYLIQSIETYAPKPWLRPLTPCFQEPGTDVELAVPSNGTFTPHLIVLSQDGSLLAVSGSEECHHASAQSASKEKETIETRISSSTPKIGKSRKVNSIRIWDVKSGRHVWTVDDIPSLVRCLALSWDCDCVIAETVDGLYFWQLEKQCDQYFTPTRVDAVSPPKSLTSITPTVKGSRVLTTSGPKDDPVITLWDTTTGKRLKRLGAVTSRATCLDVSMDNEYFASGHKNGFIHLWNLRNDCAGGDDEPVLSFKNGGNEAENGQQHMVLAKVNSTKDDQRTATVSVSFYEQGGNSSWLAAVAANDIIRVWQLPPRSIPRENKKFVSTLRTAVISCAGVRDVQWSHRPSTMTNKELRNGCFVSSGDDGVALLWRKGKSGNWESHAIGRDKRARPSDVSTVLVSCGRKSGLVATYVTKSPYVTVWDTYAFEGEDCEFTERAKLYKPYFCMVKDSVDTTDIQHLTTLKKVVRAQASASVISTNIDKERDGGSKGMIEYGHGGNVIREELESNFSKLGLKNAARLLGEMHPRLGMFPTEKSRLLEICFEQPVIIAVAGTFKTASVASRGTVSYMHDVGNGQGSQQTESVGSEEGKRSGMVAALQDGEIAIFELEDDPGGEFDAEKELKLENELSITGDSNGIRSMSERGREEEAGGGSRSVFAEGKGLAEDGGGCGSSEMRDGKNGIFVDGTGTGVGV